MFNFYDTMITFHTALNALALNARTNPLKVKTDDIAAITIHTDTAVRQGDRLYGNIKKLNAEAYNKIVACYDDFYKSLVLKKGFLVGHYYTIKIDDIKRILIDFAEPFATMCEKIELAGLN